MKNNQIYVLLFIYLIIVTTIIILFEGTGRSGDSIHHYLFAKFAPLHPKLFFNHWAKPLYVLLASPFAQFGFIGVKIFNATVSMFTIFFTFMPVFIASFSSPTETTNFPLSPFNFRGIFMYMLPLSQP